MAFIETEVAMNSKAAILADVDVSWRTGHYNEAVISLEEGLEQLQRAQNGIACLQKSIEQKETECDKNTLAPLKERKP